MVLPLHLGVEEDVRRRGVVQGEGFAQRHLVRRGGRAVLRAIVPRRVAGADEEAPRRNEVHGQPIGPVALVVEFLADAVAVVEVLGAVGRGVRIVSIGGLARRDGHGGAVRVAPVQGEGVDACHLVRCARGVEPLARVVAARALAGYHREASGGDVRGGVLREGVVVAVFIVLRRLGGEEPGVVLARVVQHVVQVNLDVPVVRLRQQAVQVGQRAQARVDGGVVRHVIAVVGHGGVDGREPQGADAQLLQVVQLVGQAAQVAPAVAVAVCKGVDQQLVGDAGTPLFVPGVGRGVDADPFGVVVFSAGWIVGRGDGGVVAACGGQEQQAPAE